MEKLNRRTFERGPLQFEVFRTPDTDRPLSLEDWQALRENDWDRFDAFQRGDWEYVGVCVDIRVKTATNWAIPHKVGSASLWGIESDSGEEYFAQIEEELIAEAEADLRRTIEALSAAYFGLVSKEAK